MGTSFNDTSRLPAWDSVGEFDREFPEADYPVRFEGSPVLRARIEHDDDVVTLMMAGELDLAAADSFEDVVGNIAAAEPRAVVVDLSGLTFMDSTGIRLLVDAHAKAADSYVFVVLDGTGPAHKVLTLVGLKKTPLMIGDLRELAPRIAVEPYAGRA